MVFSSSIFLFAFLPAVLLVYYLPLRRWRTGQNVFLFLASLFFYGWGAHEALLLMLGSILANYLLGLWAGRAARQGAAYDRRWCWRRWSTCPCCSCSSTWTLPSAP